VGAQSRLDDILDGETRNAVAKHNLVELVRSTNRKLPFSDTNVSFSASFNGSSNVADRYFFVVTSSTCKS
jgi:2-phospho-L-lactate guanylyltransferase (CobY/MobA/RfbA family)